MSETVIQFEVEERGHYPPVDAKSLRNNDPMIGCNLLYLTDAKYCGREISRHGLCAEHAKALGK